MNTVKADRIEGGHITARSLHVVDDQDRPRVVIGMDEKARPCVDVLDDQGRVRAELMVNAEGVPLFVLYNARGQLGVVLHVDEERSVLQMYNAQRQPGICLWINTTTSETNLALRDAKDAIRASLTVSENGHPGLILANENQVPVFSVGQDDAGIQSLRLYDDTGQVRAALM